VANRKISEFTALTAPDASDVLAIIDQSESGADKNKKITYANLLSKIPVGNAAAPSLSFLSDQDSGISGGTDTLVLSTGGTAAISVDSSQNVTLSANLTVSGTTTTINTTNLDVEDKNITLAKVSSPSDTTADGGGITIKGATDKTFNWVNSTDAFTSSEHIHLGDDKKLELGGAQDLSLYHDGNHSYIDRKAGGTGDIYMRLGTDNALISKTDGAVELYYDGVKKLATSSGGVAITGELSVTSDVHFNSATNAGKDVYWDESASELQFSDNVYATFGTGEDLKIYHNGNHSYIQDSGTGNLYIDSIDGNIYIRPNQSEAGIAIIENGAVKLAFDNALKLETLTAGVQVWGHLRIPDSDGTNDKLEIGNGQDLQIYHDGTHSRIKNDTGGLYISVDNGEFINRAGDEVIAKFIQSSRCEFYYDNSKKLETTSAGITVSGNIDCTGNIKVDDSDELRLGTGNDLKIYSDGTHSILKNTHSTGYTHIQVNNGDAGIKVIPSGAVELYYDDVKKFETIAGGVTVTGNFNGTGNITATTDNGKLICGAGDDFQIYHSGSANVIAGRHASADLYIQTNRDLYLEKVGANGGNGEVLAKFIGDDAVELYYDNSLKLATFSGGVYFVQTTGIASNNGADVGGAEILDDANGGVLRVSKKTTSAVPAAEFYNANGRVGQIIPNGSSTTFSTTSDYRLKENQVAISDGITRLKTLKPYRFNFKADPFKTVDGFFAHEVTAVPEAVYGTKDGTEMQSMDYGRITPLLTAALKEAIAKIETLETKVAALEAK